MSIISRISAAIAVIAFGLLALSAVSSTGAASPSPSAVLADHGWGEPQPPGPNPASLDGEATFASSDDHGWG